MKYQNLAEAIGNTPVINITKLFPEACAKHAEIWMKLESKNPGGSIKDRIALSMIEDAEEKGILKAGGTVIEPTSGNTGVGLSFICASKGYRLILTMPESMSQERRKLMKAYGAEIVLTEKSKGMKGAINKAKELINEMDNAWMPMQFENEANPKIHYQTTGPEILKDFPDGLTHLICGVGTGGHLSGCGSFLKEHYKDLKIYAVEPKESQVIKNCAPGPHAIQGIGAGFIPKVLKTELISDTIPVSKDEAYKYTNLASKNLGLLIGISSGASLAAVSLKINELHKGDRVLVFAYDTGERYLSVESLY